MMMTAKRALQTTELINTLEIRQEQLSKQMQGEKTKYLLSSVHHMRDVMTTLAVLRGDKNADALLKNMPTEDDV